MSSQTQTDTRTVIVAAIDGGTASSEVVETAAREAASRPHAELHLLHVVEPMADPDGRNSALVTLTALLENARELMARTEESVRGFFDGRVVTHLAVGDPWREILQLSANLCADLVVVGSHRRKGIAGWLLGSVSERVVRNACCPVLVARPKDYGKGAPEIEPPCPDCLASQRATSGENLWCTQHSHERRHPRARLHYERPPTFAVGSMLLRPES